MKEQHPETIAPPLTEGVVHLWMLSLDRPSQERDYFFSLLSEDERIRANKFYFETARSQFIVGRGLLRTLLGEYLHIDPARVEFDYEAHGKPMLKKNQFDQLIQFNVSHSEQWGIAAVCLNCRIGVDIEWHRPLADMDDLARQFFTKRESALLESLSGKKKRELFYRLWTCKESYLKASGEGLLIPLDQVEVRFEAGDVASLLSNDGREMSEWRVHTFSPLNDYQCAVCIESGNVETAFSLNRL